MALAFLLLVAGVAALWVGLWASPPHRVTFRDVLDADPDEGRSASAGPRVPVVVIAPGRNEAEVLPRSVPTYCEQAYPDVRVVIADDQSDDATPAVLSELQSRFPNLQTIRTTDRPAGWLGKTWAVASAVASADAATTAGGPPDGEADLLYCFTDADCLLHPLAVATAERVMRERGLDMISVVPRLDLGPPCEKVGMPGLMTVLSLLFPLGLVNKPTSPLALAAGGFIVIRRSAYRRIGGHEAVRHRVVEDVSLARVVKAAGLKVEARMTRDLISTAMYDCWADMREGLTKNAYAGMDYDPKKFWVGMIVGIAAAVLPPVYLILALWRAKAAPGAVAEATLAAAVVAVAFQAAVHARTVRHMGLPIYHALLMPVSIGLYVWLAAASAHQHHYCGGNVWKGRRYGAEVVMAESVASPPSNE